MRSLALISLVVLSQAVQAAEYRSIRVSAQSEVKVAPDEVLLQLAVHTRDEQLLTAKRDNDEIAAAVLALAPKHSVPASDVKITDLDVSPDYGSYGSRSPTPIAYDFTRSIEVRLTDFGKLEPLLSDAFEAGLSHVTGLHFRVSNQREHQFAARKLAVTYAREKAEHLTQLTGMKLGLPIRMEQDIQYNWDTGGFGGFGGLAEVDLPEQENGKAETMQPRGGFVLFQPVPTEENPNALTVPGQIMITADVTIEFEMFPE
jgi:uncharacterized protein YggE